jgi:hypothetical protein
MKTAIVGSRDFNNMELVSEILFQKLHYTDIEVVTGGARGIDTFVEQYCKQHSIPCNIITPINPKDKLSYLFRNVEIITKSDRILAFWDGQSKGTKFVIDYARARGKDVEVIKDIKTPCKIVEEL